MPKTWLDIQKETLALMFSYTLNGKPLMDATSTLDYRAAMAGVANAAFRDLAAHASPIVRKLSLSLNPVANMLGDSGGAFAAVQSAGLDIVYSASHPKAYYFEVDGACQVIVQEALVNSVVTRHTEINHDATTGYVAYRGLIDGELQFDGSVTQLRFVGNTLYNIRNVAFYAAKFRAAGDVPAFTRYNRYDLKALTAGRAGYEFMQLAPNSVVRLDTDYSRSDSFFWEGDSTIVFDHYAAGQYDIFYHAYPTEIVAPDASKEIGGTDDAFVPELCSEALDLAPLYMASRLFGDDNPAMASQYLNEYMVRRSELSARSIPLGTNEIECESGWW